MFGLFFGKAKDRLVGIELRGTMSKRILLMLALASGIFVAKSNGREAVEIQAFSAAARLALKSNADVANGSLDIAESQERFREVLSDGLPQIKASGKANDYVVIPTTVYPASALSGLLGGAASGIPTKNIAIQIGTTYNVDGALIVRQTLFDASFFAGLRVAKSSTQMSKQILRKTKEDVIIQLASAYYGFMLSQKQAGFLQKQLDSYKSLLRVVEIQLQAGVAKKSDLDRLMVNKTNIETELENIKNLAEEQISNLKLLIGLDNEKQVVILDSLSEAPIFPEENEFYDIRNRADWQILQNQEEVEHFQIRQEQAGYAPVLALTAQANKDFYDNQFKPFTGDWYNSSFVALSLDFPIFDGLKKRSQIAQSRIEFDKIRNRKTLLLSAASLEIQDAQNKLNYSGIRLQSQKTNQELAMEVYRETTVQYNGGTASLSDLLNAEASLLESQRQYLQALADKILAEFAIQKAKGVLLQDLKID